MLHATQHRIKVKVYRRNKIFMWKIDEYISIRGKQSTLAEWIITAPRICLSV
jgi:hypothetical protein